MKAPTMLRKIPGYYIAYRFVMRLAHRFNWHYMPPSYPDGDTMIWCHWCGARYVVKRARTVLFSTVNDPKTWTAAKQVPPKGRGE